MEISKRQYGGDYCKHVSIIEILVQDGGTQIICDVTNLKGEVDIDLIESLKSIVEDLEEQNEKVKARDE